MDKIKLKKIVAREGLIIIGLLSGLLLIFFSPSSIPLQKHKPVDLIEYTSSMELRKKLPLYLEIIATIPIKGHFTPYPQYASWDQIYKAEKRDLEINIERFKRNFFLPILLSVYPICWLIRFILWAIRILKAK